MCYHFTTPLRRRTAHDFASPQGDRHALAGKTTGLGSLPIPSNRDSCDQNCIGNVSLAVAVCITDQRNSVSGRGLGIDPAFSGCVLRGAPPVCPFAVSPFLPYIIILTYSRRQNQGGGFDFSRKNESRAASPTFVRNRPPKGVFFGRIPHFPRFFRKNIDRCAESV